MKCGLAGWLDKWKDGLVMVVGHGGGGGGSVSGRNA